MKKKYGLFLLLLSMPLLSQAAVGITTPSVNSGELIRAADWNKIKLDLETLAAALSVLQNQSWGSSGADIYYNAGNVGLGITSPTAVLHAYKAAPASNATLLQLGTSDDNDRFMVDEDGDAFLDGKLTIRDSDIYESGGDLEVSGEDDLYLSMDWNNNDGDNRAIYFGKNSAGAGANFVPLMVLEEGGNLGIGTTTPNSVLQVEGSVQVGNDASACVAAKTGAMRYSSGAIERCNGSTWDALATTNISDNLGNHTATQDLDLDTFKIVGGGADGVSILADGKVGIGMTNPGEKLSLYDGSFLMTDGVRSLDIKEEGTGNYEIESSGALTIDSVLGTQFNKSTAGDVVISQGNVGIGENNPDSLLQILKDSPAVNEVLVKVGTSLDESRFSVDEDGDVFADGNYYVGGGNVISSSSSMTVGGEDNLYLVADWNDNDAENRSIIFGKNGVGGGGGFEELMRVDENGEVGIGIITPGNRLHVVENSVSERIATFENRATTGSPEGLLVLTGQGAGPAPAFAVGTGTEGSHTKKFVVTNTGNLGIGTIDPDAELDIKGTIKFLADSSPQINMSGNAQINAGTTLGIASGIIQYNASGTNAFTSPLTYFTGGNVGIGTAAPTSRLQVGDGSVLADNVITLGKRTASTESNLPKIGHDSVDGIANDLAFSANSNTGGINFYTGNNPAGFNTGANDLRLRIDAVGELEVTSLSSDGTGKVVCIKSDGNLGTCTNAPNGSGVCSCS